MVMHCFFHVPIKGLLFYPRRLQIRRGLQGKGSRPPPSWFPAKSEFRAFLCLYYRCLRLRLRYMGRSKIV